MTISFSRIFQLTLINDINKREDKNNEKKMKHHMQFKKNTKNINVIYFNFYLHEYQDIHLVT